MSSPDQTPEAGPQPPEVAGPEPEIQVPADDAVIGRAFQISLMVLVLVGLIGGGAIVYLTRPEAPAPVDKSKLTLPEKRSTPTVTIPDIKFADITQAAGIKFVHENGAAGQKLLPESMGGGVAFLDYNNDGRPDILLINSTLWKRDENAPKTPPTMALYRNEDGKTFTDVTAEAGLNVSFYGQGVAVGDFDNDGWTDVFITAVGPNRLFRNNQGKFEDVTESAGVAGSKREWSTSAAFLDVDNDGDLDLFVCNYVRWSPEIDRELKCTLDGRLRAYCRPDAFEGTFPYLYRNDGTGKFTDVSADSGVQVKNPNTGVPAAKSLGIAPVDLDADGWIDLVVANDTVQNFLFHNRKDGTFEERGMSCGIALDNSGNARGAMGIDAGYFRNDDTLGLAIGNFANEMTALYCSQKHSLQFSDDAIAIGIGPPSRIWLKFGVFFADLDLDGRLDLLAANGHLESDINKVQQSQQYAQPPQIYWNCGVEAKPEFLPVPADQTGPDFSKPLVGRGAAYADIDGDGDLDVLLTATGGAPRLLRNDQSSGHHWVRVKLVGKKSNRDAIGAVVELKAAGVTQRRIIMPTRSYLSQVELPATFGLGPIKEIESLTIRWPDGTTQEAKDVKIDETTTVEQKE